MPKYTEKDLQAAIKHALREPDIPTIRIAELYGVERRTLRRRVLGTHQDRSIAHKQEQLFSPGEEKAISNYIGTMADMGFPLNYSLVRQMAQDLVNERCIPLRTKGGPSVDPESVHVVGINWVNRFLDRNQGLKRKYIRFQERARAAATNDIELQADFLRKLANLIRRKKITADNIWNCDEKGKVNIILHCSI